MQEGLEIKNKQKYNQKKNKMRKKKIEKYKCNPKSNRFKVCIIF